MGHPEMISDYMHQNLRSLCVPRMQAGTRGHIHAHLDMAMHVGMCHRMGTDELLQAPCPQEAPSPLAEKGHGTACMQAGGPGQIAGPGSQRSPGGSGS